MQISFGEKNKINLYNKGLKMKYKIVPVQEFFDFFKNMSVQGQQEFNFIEEMPLSLEPPILETDIYKKLKENVINELKQVVINCKTMKETIKNINAYGLKAKIVKDKIHVPVNGDLYIIENIENPIISKKPLS